MSVTVVTRWQVTKAIRKSELPAPSRLIMLTLADCADTGTGEIPPQWTPSLKVLAGETGLDKSTVKRHLALLEEGGWLLRSRPDKAAQWYGERTQYRLDLPRGMEPPEVGAEAAEGGSQEPTLGAQDAHPGGTERPGVGAQSAQGGRTERHLESDLSSDQSQIRPTPSSSQAPKAAIAVPERLDVEKVCRYLADRVEANGSKRPAVTKKWRDEARRLLDLDGRTVAQVMRAIDWCQDDEFWRSNILSMPKLRKQYDQLRLAAQRGARDGPRRSTTDERVGQALALAAELDANPNLLQEVR